MVIEAQYKHEDAMKLMNENARAILVAALVLTVGMLLPGCSNGAGSSSSDSPGATNGSTTSSGEPWFAEQAASAGLDFRHVNGHVEEYLMPEIVGGGGAWLDIEGDGDLDVYLVQSGSLVGDKATNPSNQLYRNDGDGTFVDITESSGAGDRGYGMGVATGDYDNDGDVDLYVTNYGPNAMFRNNGDGTFTDVTAESATGDAKWGCGAAFVDIDTDGDLDLYIANYIYWKPEVERECLNAFGRRDYCMPQAYEAPAMDTLYRNNGEGTFTDISEEAGIQEDSGNGLGVVCGDYNQDGHQDIYVANDGNKNILWINQGDGTFKNLALLAGCAVDQDGREKAGMGVTTLDIDDDGDLDLLVVNLDNESDSLYRNQGNYFVEEAATMGLSPVSRMYTRFGVGFIDFNNDGRLDIYETNGKVTTQEGPFLPNGDPYAEPNVLIRGGSNGRFEEVSPRGGTAEDLIHISRAAVFGDFDDDGGMDILVANLDEKPYLLRNIVRQRGHWIGFRILEQYGSDAIGATVSFTVADRTIVRDIRTGYSYLAANDPRIHVGLGEIGDRAVNLTVRWGDGARERFEGEFPVDQYHTVRRGGGIPEE